MTIKSLFKNKLLRKQEAFAEKVPPRNLCAQAIKNNLPPDTVRTVQRLSESRNGHAFLVAMNELSFVSLLVLLSSFMVRA
jgi:hypothetical protein